MHYRYARAQRPKAKKPSRITHQERATKTNRIKPLKSAQQQQRFTRSYAHNTCTRLSYRTALATKYSL